MKQILLILFSLSIYPMELPKSRLGKKDKKEKVPHFSSEEKRACEERKIELLQEQVKLAKLSVDLKKEELKLREKELEYLQRQAEALEMRETIAVLTLMTQYQMYRAKVKPSPSQFEDENILRGLICRSLKSRYTLPPDLSWVKKEAAQEQARAAKSSSNSTKEEVIKGG